MVRRPHCLGVKSRPISGAEATPNAIGQEPAEAVMTIDFDAARQIMVDSQVRTNDVPDLTIQHAMRRVARERFAPEGKGFLAYADAEVDYAPGRWLLRPRDVAKALQALKPRAGETALAIAAPYAGAVLAQMGLAVTQLADGDLKTPPAGSFDVIVCEGAVAVPPPAWLAALAPGGRLAVPVRDGPVGKLRLYLKSEGDLGWREAFDCTPPVMAGFEAETRFAF
jgi:protein-L-isoaspartate(D-aspartate) O-methyltransferase